MESKYQRLSVHASPTQIEAVERHLWDGSFLRRAYPAGRDNQQTCSYEFTEPLQVGSMRTLTFLLYNMGVQSFKFSQVSAKEAERIKSHFAKKHR